MDLLPGDPHSSARPEFARVIDTYLELSVNFAGKVLQGKAVLTIEREPSSYEIILDCYGLTITSVTNIVTGTHLENKIESCGIYGSKFTIQLLQCIENYNNRCTIQIEYTTSPDSPSLYWLKSKQTADGEHPFLLSNNKLTFARAWFPCQDTPSVKFTYSAKIIVPKNFRVLMSAHLQHTYQRSGLNVYKFHQLNPVPSYAVIIAVGSLMEKELNETSKIFAESKFIVESFDTFRSNINTIRKMLDIAESLCGSYFWDRYDICVLPPSIAHFEIECPCVTFISPTLLGGDRSCISSLALNISQSWAGNLVTCSNYEDWWLNKSFSIFISRKIRDKLLIHEDMKFFLENQAIDDHNMMIQKFMNSGSLKCLIPNLTDLLPHEATEYVPYETGCMLLNHVENILGGPSEFEPFLKFYFDKFAFKSINTRHWRNCLYQYFSDKKKMLDSISWEARYFFKVASPHTLPPITVWEKKFFKLAEEWVKLGYRARTPYGLNNGNNLCDFERIIFLNYLTSFHTGLTIKKLRSISYLYSFDIQNAEIRFLWLLLCIYVRWEEKVELALQFAIEFCSPNYACPIFQYLSKWTEMREKAIDMYKKNKEKMLDETQKKLAIILDLN